MLTRRQALQLSLAGSAYLSLRPLARAHATANVSAVYERSIVIDATGSPAGFAQRWPRPDNRLSYSELADLRASGVTAVDVTVSNSNLEDTIKEIGGWQGAVEQHPDHLTLIRNAADIDAAKQSGRLGLILGFQHTSMMGDDLDWLATFHGMGVRSIQLTYNKRSPYGDGCLVADDQGLTALGRQAVTEMNRLGIAVDLSHCSPKTTRDGLAATTRPPLITHSGCLALWDNPRNKDDATLKQMAEQGGVIGIYFMPFLGENGTPWATRAMVLDHIDHAINVCGEDHVGIGSDGSIPQIDETPEFFEMMAEGAKKRAAAGVQAPGEAGHYPYIQELNFPLRIESVAQGMNDRGHPDGVIEKVIGSNFQRALAENWA